ncbi:sigma factor-like helix-turn-helix DNA-binding protein [Methylobacterium phyllosphaerae]
MQFTLLNAWEHRARFQPATSLIAHLCTIVRNGFINERRKRRLEVPDHSGLHAASLSQHAEQDHRLDLKDAQAAMNRLEPTHRDALMPVADDGLSNEATATAIGCPTGTVKSSICRARDRILRDPGEAWPRLYARGMRTAGKPHGLGRRVSIWQGVPTSRRSRQGSVRSAAAARLRDQADRRSE